MLILRIFNFHLDFLIIIVILDQKKSSTRLLNLFQFLHKRWSGKHENKKLYFSKYIFSIGRAYDFQHLDLVQILQWDCKR